MSKPFLRVLPPEKVWELFRIFQALPAENVSLEQSLNRVLAETFKAGDDLPPFNRSTMDGFAVRAADTFGATETLPGFFTIIGEVLMGEMPTVTLGKGEAVRISTGGALPVEADAVVMIEHTQELDSRTVEVLKAVAPYENVVRKGEDLTIGQSLLSKGHRMRPQDIGLLAAMGMTNVKVHRTPRLGIISSGDEIVPVEMEPPPGCMRDVNRFTLGAMARNAYADPVWIGMATDSLESVSELIRLGLESCDAVLISGGSSMGTRDLVIAVLEELPDSKILVHGVSISPGKPLIVAEVGNKTVFGLPGHPISAMVSFEQFVVPLIRRLAGEDAVHPFLAPTITANLGRNIPSKEGRTDFVRVRLENRNGRIVAAPVLGKSGMISSMVRAHGVAVIGNDCEGLYKGDLITVHLFANWIGEAIEKEHLFGYEASGRGSRDISKPPQHEHLSGS